MKVIIENKVYDTEKATLIKSFIENVNIKGLLFNYGIYNTYKREIDLYKTKNDNWFLHKKKIEGMTQFKNEIEKCTKDEVVQIFKDLNDITNYEKYFSTLEEA